MTPLEARAIAEAALDHLARDPDLLGSLMAQSGLDPAGLRTLLAQEGGEAAGLALDFILEQDARVLALAREAGIAPERVAMARAVLGGADPW